MKMIHTIRSKKLQKTPLLIAISIIITGSIALTSAWTGPTSTPPTGNVNPPLNTSSVAQTKSGDLGVNAFLASSNASVLGNLGVGTSSPGSRLSVDGTIYTNTGIRFPDGTTQTTAGGSGWLTSGSSLYYNSGNVGVGTASPGAKLEVYTNTADSATLRIRGSRTSAWSTNALYFGDELNAARYFMNTRGTNENANANWRFYYYNTGGGADAWQTLLGAYPTSLNSQTYALGLHDDTLYINSSSNVGIGKTNPSYKLDVNGTTNATAYAVGGTAGITGSAWCSFTVSGGIVTGYAGCGDDVAEYLNAVGDTPQRGDIIAFADTTTSKQNTITNPAEGESTSTQFVFTTADMKKAHYGDREHIFAAVPTRPGQTLGSKDGFKNPQLYAVAGRVPIRMTLDGGDIAIGDPITVSSSTPGAGMKAITSGRIVGYAMAPFTATNRPASGMIEVLVHIDDWIAPEDRITRKEFDDLKKEIEELRSTVHK